MALGSIYYHTTVGASGSVAAAREITIGRLPANINVSFAANLNAQADLLLLSPTYTFATPVLGGQMAVGVMGIFGRMNTSIDGTLTAAAGPLAVMRTGSISDSLTSAGDLYPMMSLKWHDGVHNWMTYVTGDIPVGAYDPIGSPIWALVTVRSTPAAATPISTRLPDTNFRLSVASPTI